MTDKQPSHGTSSSDKNLNPNEEPLYFDAQMTSEEPTDDNTVSRTWFNYVVIAAVFLVVGIVIGTLTVQQGGSSLDEATVREIVAEAIASIDVGSDDSANMQQLVDDDPSLGDEDAPITIVEFSAYACPYCGRHFSDTFQPLLENYGEHIRYVYRDYPVINSGVSYPAAMAANCAREQDSFWDYHEMLFDNQDQLGDAFFRTAADDLDLDTEQFNECLDSEKFYDEVQSDYLDGLVHNINGTPAFFVNGEFYSGAQPYAFFERLIQRELDAQGISTDSDA